MLATADFVPAHLQSAIPFWRDVILPATTEADRDTLLGWIRGVSVYDFVDSRAQGTFQGRQYSGPDLTSVHLPNHVPAEHCSCFGWCSAPFIYASLSEAVARYLRSRDVPVLTWIDDFYVTNFRSTRLLEPNQQFVAAQAAASLVLDVLYQAGYFISISKCELTPSTRLVFLGIICDTAQCRFEAPADKLEKLEHILSDAITSGAITFHMLEKLAGKCTSLSVAVPVAALYTHHMYKQFASFRRTGGRHRSTAISVPKNSGLMFEMGKWLEVRKEFKGASWYRTEHKMVILTGASDASFSDWGGLVHGLHHDACRAGGDFPPALAEEHINVQEGYNRLCACSVLTTLMILRGPL